MTNETIKEVISHGVTFAKLYHPSCGFCIRMARAWKELGHVDFNDVRAPITIAELDCKEYETACRENGVGITKLLVYTAPAYRMQKFENIVCLCDGYLENGLFYKIKLVGLRNKCAIL